MKTISKIYLAFLLVAFLIVGCTKDFEDINTNPNRPVSVETGYLLTFVEKEFMDNLRDEWFGGRGTQLLCQHWSQRNYPDEDRYQIRTTTINNAWRAFYRAMMNLEMIIKLNTDEATKNSALASGPNEHQIAVAKILKVWMFQIITDVWGDVPYSEAFKANLNRQPKFDSQQSIYTSLIEELKDATDLIVPANGNLLIGDVIYGGDVVKWEKFANTLRLRIALRMSERNSSALAEVLALPASSFFESNDDNAVFKYLATAPNEGPVYKNLFVDARNDFTITKTFVDLLAGRNDVLNSKTNPFFGIVDPRLPVFAHQVNGVWQGMPYGMDDAATKAFAPNCPDYLANPSVVHAPDFGYVYMDYAEYCFIRSEAAGWDQTWYTKGIQASMEFWGVSNANITAYLGVVPAANMENVLTQKYIALYMQPEQAWAEYRRTGYPHTLLHPGEITHFDGTSNVIFEPLDENDTDIPRRMMYPIEEISVNPDSYAAAVAAMGADNQLTKVWWDIP